MSSPVSLDDNHNCANGNVYCTPNIELTTDLTGVSAWQNGHVRKQNVPGGGSQRGVFTDAQIIADSESTAEATASNPGGYADYVADEYENLVPGKQVRKFIYVKNTGTNSVYVRVKVTIPSNVANYVTVKAPHTPQETTVTGADNTNINGVEMDYAYVTESDGTDANGNTVMTFVYADALKAGEMTYWSPITTVKINDTVKETTFDAQTLATLQSTGFGITVDVDAIQSEGFANAAAAFTAYDAQ
jgi:hypothetical protein